jgi:hypothetical protein
LEITIEKKREYFERKSGSLREFLRKSLRHPGERDNVREYWSLGREFSRE